MPGRRRLSKHDGAATNAAPEPSSRESSADHAAAGPTPEATPMRLRALEREVERLRRLLREKHGDAGGAPAFPVQALVVEIDGTALAFLVADVAEVTRMVLAAALPGAPAAVRGAVNRRGHVVPLLDLSPALGREVVPLDESWYLVFVQTRRSAFCVPVQRVVEVHELVAADVDEAAVPAGLANLVRCVLRRGTSIVSLIDPDALLLASELDELTSALLRQAGGTTDDGHA